MRTEPNLEKIINARYSELTKIPNFEDNNVILNDLERLTLLREMSIGEAKDGDTAEVYGLIANRQPLLHYERGFVDRMKNGWIQQGITQIVNQNTRF